MNDKIGLDDIEIKKYINIIGEDCELRIICDLCGHGKNIVICPIKSKKHNGVYFYCSIHKEGQK